MASSVMAPFQLELGESAEGELQAAPWIGQLLALGARAARYYRAAGTRRQLVVGVSVPQRDFAAVLIACGWVLTSDTPSLQSPLEILRSIEPGTPIRAVNSQQVVTGEFVSLNEEDQPARANFAGAGWNVDAIRALAPLRDFEYSVREPRTEPGSMEHLAGIDGVWDSRLALPAADLAVIGTVNWLEGDLSAYLRREGDDLPPSSVESVLMPKKQRSATWFTRFYSSAKLAHQLPLPREVTAAILDGNGAINYLAEIEAPVVICVLDRSVGDETGAEILTQSRNSRGEPISLDTELGWTPPAGVEAFAFTLAL